MLTAQGMRVGFPVRQGWLKQRTRLLMAVDGVDLAIHAGETLALVGESGCGKSTLGKALLRLVKPVPGCLLEGEVALDGQPASLPALRRQVQMIFQDPFSSLDPRLMVGESIAEGLPLNHPRATAAERRACVGRLLTEVGLAPEDALRYPHQFSGGQRQRIGLARALAVEPKLIICDECTSALDVSVQAQILNLLRDIQARTGVAYLFITHDLSVVGYLADRVAVMYLGRIVEEGPATALFQTPAHPYTRALLEAAPRIGRPVSAPLDGDVPSPMDPPTGCPFHPRCPRATPQCATAAPAWRDLGGGHRLRCHLPPP